MPPDDDSDRAHVRTLDTWHGALLASPCSSSSSATPTPTPLQAPPPADGGVPSSVPGDPPGAGPASPPPSLVHASWLHSLPTTCFDAVQLQSLQVEGVGVGGGGCSRCGKRDG